MKSARTTFTLAVFFLCHFSNFVQAAKPPEVEIVEMALHRKDGLIEVDTTVKNLSAKPILGLTAIYQFFAPGRTPITTQRTRIDRPTLAAGAEAVINAQLEAPARAVTVECSVVDLAGKEYRVKNAGPFAIE